MKTGAALRFLSQLQRDPEGGATARTTCTQPVHNLYTGRPPIRPLHKKQAKPSVMPQCGKNHAEETQR